MDWITKQNGLETQTRRLQNACKQTSPFLVRPLITHPTGRRADVSMLWFFFISMSLGCTGTGIACTQSRLAPLVAARLISMSHVYVAWLCLAWNWTGKVCNLFYQVLFVRAYACSRTQQDHIKVTCTWQKSKLPNSTYPPHISTALSSGGSPVPAFPPPLTSIVHSAFLRGNIVDLFQNTHTPPLQPPLPDRACGNYIEKKAREKEKKRKESKKKKKKNPCTLEQLSNSPNRQQAYCGACLLSIVEFSS